MHICISKLTSIGSDNGLLPGQCQAIIWTNAGLLPIGPLETNFSEILMTILKFSFKKMRLKMLSAKWRPCCLGLNVLTRSSHLLLWDGCEVRNNQQPDHFGSHLLSSFSQFRYSFNGFNERRSVACMPASVYIQGTAIRWSEIP